MTICRFCNRFVTCDETGLCLHADTMDIFCDETYTSMAEPWEVCGETEIVEKNSIICRLVEGHTDEHLAHLHGVELLWS